MTDAEQEGKRTRTLFVAGSLNVKQRPCNGGKGPHDGPYTGRERYEAIGGVWRGMGDCEACGSSVLIHPVEAA